MKRDETLIVTLDKQEKKKLKAVAKKTNRSMSGLVRSVILSEYEKIEKELKGK